jgi:Transposase
VWRPYRRLLSWAKRFEQRQWAVENAEGLGCHLAQWLLTRGETALDVPATATARLRELSRGRRKIDTLDAAAAASVAALHGDVRPESAEGTANRRRNHLRGQLSPAHADRPRPWLSPAVRRRGMPATDPDEICSATRRPTRRPPHSLFVGGASASTEEPRTGGSSPGRVLAQSWPSPDTVGSNACQESPIGHLRLGARVSTLQRTRIQRLSRRRSGTP